LYNLSCVSTATRQYQDKRQRENGKTGKKFIDHMLISFRYGNLTLVKLYQDTEQFLYIP
jgi:hypothetical protein